MRGEKQSKVEYSTRGVVPNPFSSVAPWPKYDTLYGPQSYVMISYLIISSNYYRNDDKNCPLMDMIKMSDDHVAEAISILIQNPKFWNYFMDASPTSGTTPWASGWELVLTCKGMKGCRYWLTLGQNSDESE